MYTGAEVKQVEATRRPNRRLLSQSADAWGQKACTFVRARRRRAWGSKHNNQHTRGVLIRGGHERRWMLLPAFAGSKHPRR